MEFSFLKLLLCDNKSDFDLGTVWEHFSRPMSASIQKVCMQHPIEVSLPLIPADAASITQIHCIWNCIMYQTRLRKRTTGQVEADETPFKRLRKGSRGPRSDKKGSDEHVVAVTPHAQLNEAAEGEEYTPKSRPMPEVKLTDTETDKPSSKSEDSNRTAGKYSEFEEMADRPSGK